MPMRMISQSKENPFEIGYVVKWDIEVATSEKSLAKTYEQKNEMIVTLKVPKVEYKDEGVQKLLKWAELPVYADDYYRDLSVNMQVMEDYEKTVVFTHAEIRTYVIADTKADFVTIQVIVNQKRDKYVGVAFGEELDGTYQEAR